METFGAESLNEAVKSDKTVVLDGIKSIAKSLGSTKVSEACNLPAIRECITYYINQLCIQILYKSRMYYDEGDNKAKATDFINMVLDLCEDKMGANEKLNFGDWKPSMLPI